MRIESIGRMLLGVLITIGITCYNSASTILEAIQSAEAQAWPEKEILIVDDGSTDGSKDIIAKHVKSSSICRFVSLDRNMGVSFARNTIIHESRGEFLAFFDDDDVSAADRLNVQYSQIMKCAKKTNNLFFVCHAARKQVYPDGSSRIEEPPGQCSGAWGEGIAQRVLYGKLGPELIGSAATCSQMGHISIYRELGGFDESLPRSEDTDFIIRLGLEGGGIIGVKTPLVTQWMTSGSEKTMEREFDAMRYVVHKYKNFLEREGWYQFVLRWERIKYARLKNRYHELLLNLTAILLTSPVKLILKIYWALPARSSRNARDKFLKRIS